MKTLMQLLPLLLVGCLPLGMACQQQNKPKTEENVAAEINLFDKDLSEIKKLIDGKWELVSGKNAREFCEYENTFIEFDGDKYVWIEDEKPEPGLLNWRKADTGVGYESFLMDVFFETNPAYPLSMHGDTLFLQDCSQTGYKYTLLKR